MKVILVWMVGKKTLLRAPPLQLIDDFLRTGKGFAWSEIELYVLLLSAKKELYQQYEK
jgi:hypothetical protein